MWVEDVPPYGVSIPCLCPVQTPLCFEWHSGTLVHTPILRLQIVPSCCLIHCQFTRISLPFYIFNALAQNAFFTFYANIYFNLPLEILHFFSFIVPVPFNCFYLFWKVESVCWDSHNSVSWMFPLRSHHVPAMFLSRLQPVVSYPSSHRLAAVFCLSFFFFSIVYL